MEKEQLPSYSAAPRLPRWQHPHGFHVRRRGRILRLAGLACLLFIGYSQWTQLQRTTDEQVSSLALDKLQADLAMCASLRSTPSDAEGFGRTVNARHVDGHQPTLIRNATVWVGEPVEGTTAAEARVGQGYGWITADVLVEKGLIKAVSPVIGLDAVPAAAIVWNAHGRQLTAGIIDMHSHAGVDSLPELVGNEDTNEMSSDITPYVRSIDGIQPQDHQIQVIKSGGVTTSLVLPGSGNNIGGEAYVIKHAVGRHDGRPELSIASLLAAPDAPGLRYIKMACGENAKRIYGKVGERGPYSRLGESWEFRHAFEQAQALVQTQDDWCAVAEPAAARSPAALLRSATSYLPRDLQWDTLAAVLRGQVRVNTHCYTIPDLEAFVDHTNEFKFPIWAFHHAHQTFLVPEVLKRAWGADRFGPPASAIFADNMYYKAEAYVGSEYASKLLYDNGLTPIFVSDNPVLNAQHVLFEAAKGYHYGLPYHAALAAVTTAPAQRLGLGNRLGLIKAGYDADIVVWDSDPLSVGAAPVQVWIDGVAQFDDPVELVKPASEPIVPDAALAAKSEEEPVAVGGDVVFTGVAKVLLPGFETAAEETTNLTVAVTDGRVTCVGACTEQLQAARAGGSRVVSLQHGYLASALTAFGSKIGLNEIDAERDTDNGPSGDVFSRAVDGLALGGKKLAVALQYGVTRAVTAPKLRGAFTHFGTSAGFLTGGGPTALTDGVVFAPDAAVHYTLSLAAKQGSTPSVSSAVGALRIKLLQAVAARAAEATDAAPFSEASYLQQVVAGTLALSVTAHSADMIAALLAVKKDVEAAGAAPLRLIVLGGAESFLLAEELAAADVGVVLAPLQSYRASWEERRALTGAPLTNGTAIDVLIDAGVVVAIGLEEDWLVRDLALLAGVAYKNSGGRLSEKTALDLVSTNVYKLLGQEAPNDGHFVVYEGSPLEIGSTIRAVGGGLGRTTVFA